MSVELQQDAAGVVAPVQVRAAARRNTVVGVQRGRLRVDVTAAPDKGKANAAVVKLIAEFFQVPKSRVELIAGRTNPRKRFLLCGLSLQDVERRIASLSDSAGG